MLRFLLKIVATLVGLPLSLGGFFGFWYGIYLIFAGGEPGGGIAISVVAVIALALGTALGKFARGDYDW